uniref:Uncharacterized protein n=1 Tax=Coturnix japonica TaxID=93934 RepID=A0A8C2TKV5_COTJA
MGELRVRSVLVTGANRGEGQESVHLDLLVCAHLVLPTGLRRLASKHPNLVIVRSEVTDPPQHQAATASVGSASRARGSTSSSTTLLSEDHSRLTPETLRDMSDVYTTNTNRALPMSLLCACFSFPSPQAFLPLLKKAAQGSPGSGMRCTAGSIKEILLWESEQCLSYRCSKAALNMLTRCQSMGYREHGILCMSFHPGWVQTDMGNKVGDMVGASIGGMLRVLSNLSDKDSGSFLDWKGTLWPGDVLARPPAAS